MSETIQERIDKLYQILNGKILKKRLEYPLLTWDTMIDFLLAFYDYYCNPADNSRNKSIRFFNKLYGENVKELKSLRIQKDDFELIKVIGKGHFGEVAVVKEKSNENVYAMKILKKEFTLSNDNTAFFFEERDIMAFANSQWVTNLQYAFQDSEYLYLVMEFLPGGDLLNLINKYDDCMMDEESSRFYLAEIIIATNSVHKIGYVHRDIKPENILIDMTGHIKLADFGSAAKLLGNKMVSGKMPVGTPEYIAPEVLTSLDSSGGKYGTACDYWSIGVLAYEIICGMLPFESETVLKLYSQIMDHKNTLEFPDDVTLEESTKKLIKELIADQKERLDYSGCAKHEFFSSMDWTTIRNMAPPNVPTINNNTDTSNFEEVKSTFLKKVHSSPKTFSGDKSLPFIGFSFTRELSQRLYEKTSSTPTKFQSVYDINRTATTLNRKNVKSNSVSLNSKVEELNNSIKTYKEQIESINTKLIKVETEKNYLNEEATKHKGRYEELSGKYDEMLQHKSKLDLKLVNMMESVLEAFEIDFSDKNYTVGDVVPIIQKKYKSFKDESFNLVNNVESLKSEILSLKQKNDYLKSEFEANQNRYDDATSENKVTIKELQNRLEAENQATQTSIGQLKSQLLLAQNKVAQLESELNTSKTSTINTKSSDLDFNLLKTDLDVAASNINGLTEENENLKSQLNSYTSKSVELTSTILKLEAELDVLNNKIKDDEITILKSDQSLKEKQLEIKDMKAKVLMLESSIADVMNEKSILSEEMKKLNEEKLKFKNELIETEKRFKEDMKNDKNHISLLTDSLQTKSNKVEELSKHVSFLENNNRDIEIKCKTLETQLEILKTQMEDSKSVANEEEIKNLRSYVQSQKESNYSLLEDIERQQEEIKSLEEEKNFLESEVEKYKNDIATNTVRYYGIINQQSKLIEFLQSLKSKKKLKEFEKFQNQETPKNKNLNDKSKEKHKDKEKGSKFFLHRSKRRVDQYEAEKDKDTILRLTNENKKQEEECNILKNEIAKLKKIGNDITSHRFSSEIDLRSTIDLNIGKRTDSTLSVEYSAGHHNVDSSKSEIKNAIVSDHVYEMHVRFGPNICNVCLVPFYRGEEYFRCETCYACCHSVCMDRNYLKCTKNAFKWPLSIPSFKFFNENSSMPKDFTLPAMGWLNMIVKNVKTKYDWVRVWFVVTKSHLMCFNQEKTEQEILSIDMENNDCMEIYKYSDDDGFFVQPCIERSTAVRFLNTTSISRFFGVSTTTKTSNKAPLLLFDADLFEKAYWVTLLHNQFTEKNAKLSFPSILCSISKNFIHSINCWLQINENITLIGSESGLYTINTAASSSSNNKNNILMQFPVFSKVYCASRNKEFVYIIYGNNRKLLKFESKLLVADTKIRSENFDVQKYKILDNLSDCVYVCCGKGDLEKYIAVATIKNIFILKGSSQNPSYSLEVDNFVKTMRFTPHGLLYCSQYPCLLNLKTKEIKSFLNSNDNSLFMYSKGQNSDIESLMGIFLVSEKKTPPEYLFCYSENGIFINQEGKMSRNFVIKWPDTPISLYFKNRDLYVNCPSCVYIYKIPFSREDSQCEYYYNFYRLNTPLIVFANTKSIFCCASDANSDFHFYQYPKDDTETVSRNNIASVCSLDAI